MIKFKKIISLTIISVLLFTISACGNESQENKVQKVSYDKLKAVNAVSSGVVHENNKYEMSWDSERYCIILKDKASGMIWSTIPYDFYLTNKNSGKDTIAMSAPIKIEYFSSKNSTTLKKDNGYTGLVKYGKVGSESIKNGVKVKYYFDKLKIMVPVEYVLTEKGISISIVVEEIVEYDNLLYKISIAPFFCSSNNSANRDEHYLVIPSGNGALIYTDNVAENKIKEYSEMVYGDDYSRPLNEKNKNTELIRMPIFGAKNGNTALLGIIENGADFAFIDAIAGDEKIGYSAVYPTFLLRSSSVSAISFEDGSLNEVENISHEIVHEKKITVSYYPLVGENATYTGMSKTYRDYLNLQKIEKETYLTLVILGGLQIKSLMMGLPYLKTVSATDFKETVNVIKKVKKVSSLDLDVVLLGYGKTGLDIGEIAGGLDFSSVFGSKKDYIKLSDYCQNNKINMYMDFDIINFRKSSNGFSKIFDAAKSANSFTAYQKYYSPSTAQEDKRYEKFVLLKRAMLDDAAEKVFDFAAKMEMSGIGLSSLGNMSYSDYSSQESYVRANMSNDVKSILSEAEKKGFEVVLSKPNDYAAISADKIIDAPISSSKFDVFGDEIPLYQMTFKGYKDLALSSINTAINSRKCFLQAIECGSGISFTLSANYDTLFASSKHSAFSVSYVNDNLDLIEQLSNESKEFYKAVQSSSVKKHSILSDDIRYTEFDNGVEVWINYSENDVELDVGTVPAMNFIFREG